MGAGGMERFFETSVAELPVGAAAMRAGLTVAAKMPKAMTGLRMLRN